MVEHIIVHYDYVCSVSQSVNDHYDNNTIMSILLGPLQQRAKFEAQHLKYIDHVPRMQNNPLQKQ